MGETMKCGSESANSPVRAGESKGERDRVAIALGRRLYLTPDSARKVIYGDLPFRVAQVIGAFEDVGDWERRERWLAPIRAAQQKVAFEPYSEDLLKRAQRADSDEENAQTDFQLHGAAARDRYIQALIEQATTSYALAMALINERREAAA
jgi:hypothetical protein